MRLAGDDRPMPNGLDYRRSIMQQFYLAFWGNRELIMYRWTRACMKIILARRSAQKWRLYAARAIQRRIMRRKWRRPIVNMKVKDIFVDLFLEVHYEVRVMRISYDPAAYYNQNGRLDYLTPTRTPLEIEAEQKARYEQNKRSRKAYSREDYMVVD